MYEADDEDDEDDTPAIGIEDLDRVARIAKRAAESGDIYKAIMSWEAILDVDPEYADTLSVYAETVYHVGLVHEGNGEAWKALPLWEDVVLRGDGSDDAWVLKAEARLVDYSLR